MNSNKPKADPNFALWTLGGVAIELFLLIPTLYLLYELIRPFPPCPSYQYHPAICPPYPSPFPIYPVLMPSLVLYFTVPVLYCIYASCKQKPKRIVSPRQIGFWTVIISGLIVVTMLPTADLFIYATATRWVEYLGYFAFVWLLALAFVGGVVGYFQTLVVRSVVGLNEGQPKHITYRINADLAEVREVVLKEPFLDFWRFKEMPHPPELVLKSRRIWQGAQVDNLIIATSVGNDQTLLHGTAFIEDLYEIRADDISSNRLDQIVNAVVGSLGVAKGDSFIDEHLKSVAEEFVSQRTRTKFTVAQTRVRSWVQALRQMEKHYRNAIILTFVAWGLTDGLIGLLYANAVQFDVSLALIEANVGFFIALVVELGVPAVSMVGRRG